ncbi:MAG: hypothetical protein HFH84_19010 [Lachnospiraceae bacterium]|nr:hypothetical protein [Lachnospiraceae bacterium]
MSSILIRVAARELTAGEVLELYKSRDASEKLLRGETSPGWGTRSCGCSQMKQQAQKS